MTGQARRARAACFFCALSLIGAELVSAQALTSLEFSFSNPGARSLGFGGAFAAVADDATASFANPSGLVQIAEPEVSIEGRRWSYSTPYTRGGRAAGTPTGIGIDVVSTPLSAESEADLSGISFVSFVYPLKRWSIALFRHQLANFEFGLETQGVFGPIASGGTGRTVPERSRIDLEITTLGLALGFRATDRLSLGLGLSYFEPDFTMTGWGYRTEAGGVEPRFAEARFLPESLVQTVDFRMDETDWGWAGGFLWRAAESWSVAGFYREGPESEFSADLVAGPAHPDFPDGFKFVEDFPQAWDFPDVYGLGVAYRSGDGRWTAAFEWDRVEYSILFDNLLPQQTEPGLTLDDADELHLGGEYAFFAGTSVVAVRLGLWHDPDHQFRFEGDPDQEPFLAALFPGGDDELHLAAGLGVALRRFQVDLGVDLSDRVDTASLSAIYSF